VLWAYGEAVREGRAARAAERFQEAEAEKVRKQKEIADGKAEEAVREARRAEREAKRADEQADRARLETSRAQVGRADAHLISFDSEVR
jgi:hypothetical protein